MVAIQGMGPISELANRPLSIEITVSVTGKIPRRAFENFSPTYVIKETHPGSLSDGARLARQKALYAEIHRLFNAERDNIRLEELQEQFKNLRFTLNHEDGRKYPHVTDILYWDAEFYMSPDHLSQYGARGSAIHSMIDYWITHKKWEEKAINKRDLIILKNGSLKLYETLGQINFLGFMAKFGKDIEFADGEFRSFNKEHFYCGQLDRIGKYRGVPTIFDFKCRAGTDDDFKQMAMYLKLDDLRLKGIKNMVTIPLNPNNKVGYGRPIVSDEIEKNFNLALRDRHDFKDKFGI